MSYRDLDIKGGQIPGNPPVENVVARRTATKISAHQQFAGQDRVVGSGRRILATLGMGPVDDCFVSDSIPDYAEGSNPDPIYPDDHTWYTVGRWTNLPVTPGHVLMLSILAIPSGVTQKNLSSAWEDDQRLGRVRVTVTLTNEDGDTEAPVRVITVPISQLDNGKKPQSDGAAWGVVIEKTASLFVPEDMDTDIVDAAQWGGPFLTAAIHVEHLGSLRLVDLSIHEEPRRVTRAKADDNWPSHLYASNGSPLESYPYNYLVEQAASGDPALGAEHLVHVAREQGFQLGPMLFAGSCWDQGSATITGLFSSSSHNGMNDNGTGDDEAEPITVDGDSDFYNVLKSSWWPRDRGAGYAMGCGGYGRQYRTSDPTTIMRRVDGLGLATRAVVPVVVGIYVKKGTDPEAGTTVGWIRFWTSEYSYIEIEVTTSETSYGWLLAEGELECGIGPEDIVRCQILGAVHTTGDFSLRYWFCAYRSDPP